MFNIFLQEFLVSAFEERIIHEIELRIMRITYSELVTEDGELTVTVAEEEAMLPAFDTPVKNYRIVEAMGVTFHCKMAGAPLPKVPSRICCQRRAMLLLLSDISSFLPLWIPL